MKTLTSTSILFLFVLSNCTAQPVSGNLNQFQWVLGKWEMKTPKRTLYEHWVVLNDSTFQGKSFKLTAQKDTVILETVQIALRNKKFYYIPTVSDQNNQQPVYFEITQLKDNEFVAENPKHDFPQRIGYKRNGDAINAWIDGKINGQYAKEEYPFKKL